MGVNGGGSGVTFWLIVDSNCDRLPDGMPYRQENSHRRLVVSPHINEHCWQEMKKEGAYS